MADMLTEASNFLDDSTGLEKTLRLVQGMCTVFAGLAATAVEEAAWSTAKSQINLGRCLLGSQTTLNMMSVRRYRRLTLITQDEDTYDYINGTLAFVPRISISIAVMLARWRNCSRWESGAFWACTFSSRCLRWWVLTSPAMQSLADCLDQTNAMGITSFDWGPQLQLEALKCWFYGISFSLVLGYYQLATLHFSASTAPTPTKATSENSTAAKDAKDPPAASREDLARKQAQDAARSKITTQLAIDHCDLFLPGSAVGWIPAGQAGVGLCQSISSILAMQGVWEKVNVGTGS